MNTAIKTLDAPQAIGPYSQAIVTENLVFVSGQIHLNAEGILIEGTTTEKTHQIMRNLKSILEESGFSFKDVVKVTVYLTDMSSFTDMNEVYKSYMSEPYPARETVGVKELPKGATIEMSMIAVKS